MGSKTLYPQGKHTLTYFKDHISLTDFSVGESFVSGYSPMLQPS